MSKALERKMSEAESYQEWKEAAIAYDERNGLVRWQANEQSKLYDYGAIRRRLEILHITRRAEDNQGLLFTLNEGIHGNLGGMGKAALYERAKFSTKHLINEYVEEVGSALEHLAKPRLKGVSVKEKTDFFHRAHLCYGQSALMFSGSGSYLFFHVGVLKALWEQDLIPDVISGSSGGAMIAAVAGSRPRADLGEMFTAEFLTFDDQIDDIVRNLAPGKKRNIRHEDLVRIIERVIPDVTFEEAFQISGLKINISIAPHQKHQKSRLMNAITSPNVMLREAVLASCSVPGVFPPVRLAARDVRGNKVPYLPTRKWVDGSLSEDLPMKRLSRLYGVNHYIVSQTNPLVLPFLSTTKDKQGVVSTLTKTSLNTMKDWGLAATHLLQKPFGSNQYVSKLLNAYASLVSQTYTGDINILPASHYKNPLNALSSRSTEEVMKLVHEGENSTWPMIERIRIQTHVSRILNRIIGQLDGNINSPAKRSAQPVRKQAKNLKLIEKKTDTKSA